MSGLALKIAGNPFKLAPVNIALDV